MKTITAKVEDANHRTRGEMLIKADFDKTGPGTVEHAGQTYHFTGKTGINSMTGIAVREMATSDDARIWITLDGAQVWED